MILKILEKLGRKKIVLDRGPSHPEFNKAKPWMERYYVLFRKRPKWFPFNILIHKMLDDDHTAAYPARVLKDRARGHRLIAA